MRYFFIATYLLLVQQLSAQNSATEKLETLIQQFEEGYYELDLPGLVLDFKTNLTNELQTGKTAQQQAFFLGISKSLDEIAPQELSKELTVDYEILRFETSLNLERLALLTTTPKNTDPAPLDKIYDFEQGAEWYAWFVKKWTGSEWTPEQIMAFGKTEVIRIKTAVAALDLSQPKPASFLTNDEELILEKLRTKRAHINALLPQLLPNYKELPALNIRRGTNPQLAQTPGYYSGNTFYFNLFDKPFDLADCDWLLIHEGNPRHHFQVNYHQQLTTKAYRRGLRNMGFIT